MDKAEYEAYIESPEWKEKRREYFKSKLPKNCVVCGEKKVDIHHRTYRRLGNENLEDLEPLCHPCHWAGHELLRMLRESGQMKQSSRYPIGRILRPIKRGTNQRVVPEGWEAPKHWGEVRPSKGKRRLERKRKGKERRRRQHERRLTTRQRRREREQLRRVLALAESVGIYVDDIRKGLV